MRVTGLVIYPVKSLRGYTVPAGTVDALGFVGDRRFLVVDETGTFLTQRTVPRMALVDARLSADTLLLSAEGAAGVSVGVASDPAAPLRTVNIWKSQGLKAEDCGTAASKWLTDFLRLPCHLVRIGRDYVRPVLKSAAQPGDLVSFADAEPFLVVGESSLAELNNRIQENQGEPVPMNRFRPNIVVDGCAAFAEDHWSRVRIGNVVFRHGGLCARCIITTTDQLTGERTGKEPLKTLASFRRDARDPSNINFGVNLIQETKEGIVRLGDTVTPVT
ncbi:MAG TPA: MOSC N-terminal beta barrel domain-containing protein [Lacunisphaera sp.]|nr:MOSC N-terminal beta barrel domain-containing protein [Lacunisphaera sp.]